MDNRGNWLGLAVVLALLVAWPVYLYSRSSAPPQPAPVSAGTGASALPVRAGEPAWRPPALPSGDAGPGLTLESLAVPARRDVRGFSRLALFVPAGAAPSQFVPAGPFRATFRGVLRIAARDRYVFSVVGSGVVEFRIGGEVVLAGALRDAPLRSKRRRLKKGEHPFSLRFSSPESGDAALRVQWQSRDFPREPVPSSAVGHGASPQLAAFARLRQGHRLATENRCGRCHGEEPGGPGVPSLADAGSRWRPDWLVQWILDPQSLRRDASMPKMLHGSAAPQEAADLAAYLTSLGSAPPAVSFTADQREKGATLFVDQGCLACHSLQEDGEAAAPRLSLAAVAAKFHPAALVAYLRDPTVHYPDSPMPNYRFSAGDARALAAFLLSRSTRRVPTAQLGDLARGKALAAQRGCAVCHGLPVLSTLRAAPRAVTAGGRTTCKVADFGFTDAQHQALRDYLVRRLPGRPTAAEAVEYEVVSRRCVQCHAWRGREPTWSKVQGEAHALVPPEPDASIQHAPPHLTAVGAKLRGDWLQRWLAGEIRTSPRPWQHMRMPKFALDAKRFAAGLAHLAGLPLQMSESEQAVVADLPDLPSAQWTKLGEKLTAREGGLNCVQCHAIGSRPAEEVFEAPGINLALSPARLRKAYYHRWVFDPLRIDPATKMTKFADGDGLTGLTDVLEGQATHQFEAIWRYLQSLQK